MGQIFEPGARRLWVLAYPARENGQSLITPRFFLLLTDGVIDAAS
jgi:hypothetical protein